MAGRLATRLKVAWATKPTDCHDAVGPDHTWYTLEECGFDEKFLNPERYAK